jgi:hypothetical protein
MATTLLANRLAPVRDDHIVTTAFEVFNQVGSNLLFRLLVINDNESSAKAMCLEQLIELARLKAVVLDLLSVDGYGFPKNLCSGLRAFCEYVVLGESWDGGVESARNVLEVFCTKAAPIPR